VTGSPPPLVDTLIGRERELADVTRLLTESRLVTLAGTGGVGKTRLAREVADRLGKTFPDGVYRVELAAIGQPDLMAVAVAAAVHPKRGAGRPAIDTVVEALSERRVLLVLDNCEHLVESCAMFVEAVLRRCGRLVVLATSREVLHVPGEIVYQLAGLPVEPHPEPPTTADLARADATRLFTMRAWDGDTSRLTGGDAAAVRAICRRLDGLPLAIELLAPLVGTLPLGMIADQLTDRLLDPTAGVRAGPARHRSLRAAFEWSHELLASDERAVFRRLSVFVGGFDAEDAERVCADVDVPAEAVLDVVSRLEAKSLIVPARPADIAPPLRMLDSIRLFAHEQLVAHGETQATYDRLVGWLAEVCRPLMDEPVTRQTRRFAHEVDNFLHALGWLERTGDDRVLLLASGFTVGLRMRGDTWYARHVVARALRSAPLDSPYRTLALGEISLVEFEADRRQAGIRLIRRAVDLQRRRDRPALLARLLSLYGRELTWAGDESAGTAITYECLEVTRACGDELAVAMVRHNLAWQALARGDLDEATSLMEGVWAVVEAEAGPPLMTAVRHTCGVLAIESGDVDEATRCFVELIRSCAQSGSEHFLAAAGIKGLTVVAARTARPERCLTLAGALARLYGDTMADPGRFSRQLVQDAVALARTLLPKARADAAFATGKQLTAEAAIEYALTDAIPGGALKVPDPRVPLGAREWQVAALVAEGLTNKQIAHQLGTSARTVEAQVRSIRMKLDMRTRAQMAAWFTQRAGHHPLDESTAVRPSDA
jgi:predicted ATPase/DNA-binding CsgD family transcriptional regulator